MTEIEISDDFRRDPFPATLAGSQPKFAGRMIDGKFVMGLAQQDRAEPRISSNSQGDPSPRKRWESGVPCRDGDGR